MPQLLAPPEVADVLDVSISHVYRLLDSGRLEEARVGSHRLVEQRSVRRYLLVRPSRGRPIGPARAWAVLLAASAPSLDDLAAMAGRFRRRSSNIEESVMPDRLDEVTNIPDGVVSGSLGAADQGVGIGETEPRQVYVRSSHFELVQRRHGIGDAAEPNAVFRFIDDEFWPFHDGEHLAPLVVCALDAYEVGDLRSAQAILNFGGSH